MLLILFKLFLRSNWQFLFNVTGFLLQWNYLFFCFLFIYNFIIVTRLFYLFPDYCIIKSTKRQLVVIQHFKVRLWIFLFQVFLVKFYEQFLVECVKIWFLTKTQGELFTWIETVNDTFSFTSFKVYQVVWEVNFWS